MKIFLTGVQNVVGRRVAYILAKSQHTVSAAVANASEARAASKVGAKPLIINLLKVDDVQAALYGQEAVIHLASAAWDPRLWVKDHLMRRALALSVTHACLKNKVPRLVQDSAVYLYADQGTSSIDEDGRWRPGAPTSSAVAVERNALEVEKVGITGVVLRYGTVYSADSPETRGLLKFAKFGYAMQRGPEDGYVSMLHADDAATAAVTSLTAPEGVYNVVEDHPLTRRESAQALATAVGKTSLAFPSDWVRSFFSMDPAPTGACLKVSNQRFKTATGWKPVHPSLREGWRNVVAQSR